MRSRRVPTVPLLAITDEERVELQRRVRAHTTPQRAAKRARIVLLAADGVPNRQIAPIVGMNEHTVAQWRRRFEAERLAGLQDRKRSGRPLVYDHDQRLRIVATVIQQPPDPASHWSHSQLAQAPFGHRHLGLPGRPDPGRPGHQAAPGAQLDHPPQRPRLLGASR
jgi:transposase